MLLIVPSIVYGENSKDIAFKYLNGIKNNNVNEALSAVKSGFSKYAKEYCTFTGKTSNSEMSKCIEREYSELTFIVSNDIYKFYEPGMDISFIKTEKGQFQSLMMAAEKKESTTAIHYFKIRYKDRMMIKGMNQYEYVVRLNYINNISAFERKKANHYVFVDSELSNKLQ